MAEIRAGSKNQPEPGWAPAWSPDGKRIAFGVVLGGNHDIYTLTVDGNDLRRITRNIVGDGLPAWHPDGRTIAFMSWWARNSDIYHIDVNGVIDNRRRLTRHPQTDTHPTWVPAGYFSVSPTAETQTTLWGRLKQSVHD